MSRSKDYKGKMRLDFYKDSINELKKETKRFNNNLEEKGLSKFSLDEMGSSTSLVSRTFGEPEIIFSLAKQKPPRGISKFTHVDFKNKLYLNGSESKSYSKCLKELFEESNERLLDFYKKGKLS